MSELLNASSTLIFFDKINDCKLYWKLVKKAAYSVAAHSRYQVIRWGYWNIWLEESADP